MSAPLPLYALPAIGAVWPGQGGTFAGLVRDSDGRTRALILADAKPAGDLKWTPAKAWAAELRVDDHADFALPNRAEARVLWANLKDSFEPQWHWLSEQYDRSYAWYQYFLNGGQSSHHKGSPCRARAVRSFVLHSFDPSAAGE